MAWQVPHSHFWQRIRSPSILMWTFQVRVLPEWISLLLRLRMKLGLEDSVIKSSELYTLIIRDTRHVAPAPSSRCQGESHQLASLDCVPSSNKPADLVTGKLSRAARAATVFVLSLSTQESKLCSTQILCLRCHLSSGPQWLWAANYSQDSPQALL